MNDYSLDPDNWDEFQNEAHKLVDFIVAYLKNVRERKVWQEIPNDIKNEFRKKVPMEPMELEKLISIAEKKIAPYPQGNIHPRFFGWVNGTGTPVGILAEMLAAAMNVNAGGREHISNYVERQVLSWIKTLFDYPTESSGLITSGCSESNLIGITVARNHFADSIGINLRETGMCGIPKITIYGSTQIHSSIIKAVELIGIGKKQLRMIAVDREFKIKLTDLENKINEDINNGYNPFCVVANVGSVNTGAIDDLIGIRRICDKYNLWMHVDGAFGSLIKLSEYKDLVNGIELADSIAFDFHKWMFVQYDAGGVLIKDNQAHLNTFSLRPDYLESESRGLAAGGRWFSEYGIQLSRGFRALKIWMSIKNYGIKRFGNIIAQNIKQAKYLGKLIEKEDHLRLMAPVITNIVCFKYIDNSKQLDEDLVNREIMIKMHERGKVVTSSTRLNGEFCLRVAITNHRTHMDDMLVVINEVKEVGEKIININTP